LAARSEILGNFTTQSPHELLGVLSIAPGQTAADKFVEVGSDGPFFLIIQGSGDGDSTAAAPSLYDNVLAVEVEGETQGAARKALVWANNVEHSDWGGQAAQLRECMPTTKALALLEAYVGGFIEASIYDDPDALALFFDATQPTPVIPPSIADPVLWPEYDGEARVYGNSSHWVNPSAGYESWAIDRFENIDALTSDSGLSARATFSMFDEQPSGGPPLLFNTHNTTVGIAELTFDPDGDFVDSMEWCLSCEVREALVRATTLTFRLGFERDEVADCVGEEYPLPGVRLVVEDDEGNTAAVDVAEHARLALPDTREAFDECSGAADSCRTNSWLQATVRVPVDELCQTGITLESVHRLRIEFSSPNPVEQGLGTLVIFDDVELHRVPGEPTVSCRCGG